LPEPDVVGPVELDVDVTFVAGPVVGALELVVPGELVDVVCGVPLPVVVVVVPDWSSAATGSVVLVVVVDDLPLVELVPSSEPSVVPVPSVVDDVPELSVAPVVVPEGDWEAGSAMWPAGVCG
jgi:hypothetical protein